MSKCYRFIESDIVLNEEQLIDEIRKKLKSPEFENSHLKSVLLKAENSDPILDRLEEIRKVGENHKHNKLGKDISITHYIEAIHVLPGVNKEPIRLGLKFNEDNSLRENYVRQLMESNPGMGRAEAIESFNELMELEEINSKAGTYVHNFVDALIKYGEGSPEFEELKAKIKSELLVNDGRIIKQLTDQDKDISYTEPDKAILKLISIAKQEVKVLDSVCKPEDRKAIYTEFPIYLSKNSGINLTVNEDGKDREYEGLIGIADVIIVDKNDNIIIGDFKVSTKHYPEWTMAKKNKTDYLVGLERAMLAAQGINGKKISLYTFPVYMEKQKISTMKVPDRFGAGDNSAAIYLLDSTSASGESRLDWEFGKFTKKIRDLNIGGDIQVEETIDHDGLEAKILEDFGELIGTHESIRKLNKEKFILDNIHPKYDPEGKEIIGYYFFDDINYKEIIGSTKEELTKEGGLIDKYFHEIELKNSKLAETIIRQIKEFNDKKTKIEDQTFLHSSKNPGLQLLMRDVFSKYINSGWEIEDRIPELQEHNILLFKKKLESGGTIVEAVIISDKLLDTRIPINGTDRIIGKYVTTDESRKITEFKPLPSEYQHVKSLELISALNTIASNHPDIFANIEFGKLEVISLVGKQRSKFVDTKNLLDNFHFLCKQANILDNFHNEKIRVSTPYELHMTELLEILHGAELDDKLKNVLSKIDYNENTLFKKAENVKLVILKMREEYPKFAQYADFNSHREYDLNKPEDLVYITLCSMYNYLRGINLSYDGRLTKYGLNIGEIFKILGMPFFNNTSDVLKNGNVSTGWAQGMQTTSPQTNPSAIIRLLTAYYDLQYQSIRSTYLKLMNKIQLITKPYIKEHYSGLSEIISSGNLKMWENLLEKDESGKVKKELIIKDPWDSRANLSDSDRKFLKLILWEINKYILNVPSEYMQMSYKGNESKIDSLRQVKEAKSNGSYFFLPLKRASGFLNLAYLRKTGPKKYGESMLESLRDNFDYRQLHSTRAAQLKNADVVQMYNAYDLKLSERRELIDSVNNPYNFVFDLDLLASDVAFLNIRKSYFDDALLLTETIVAAMHVMQNGNTNVDFLPVLDTIQELKKASITGESNIDEEFEDLAKGAGFMKKINSIILLGFRPLLFLKELTFGMFTNYSRAWALKYTSNKLSFNSVFQANKLIWGQSGKKFCKTLAGGSLVDFTLCEMLNKEYGIANEDLNRFVDSSTIQGKGLLNNHSRYMYISSSAPDYFNRMTLLIAKMIEDGCLDAHTLDEYGDLHYDWKKDKRFSELAKHGLNSDYKGEEYLKQKAVYRRMCEEFEKGNDKLITWDKEHKKYIYGDLPRAYTTDERNSIKEVADTAYGFYDHESKSLINHKFFGLLFLQFQTFLSAKINLWFKAKPTSQGSNTSQGHWEVLKEDGEIVYREPEIDEAGNLTGKINHYKESEVPEALRGKLEPEIYWQGDYIEGLIYSVGGMLHDIFHLNWNGLFDDKYRLANVKLAMHDLLIGLLLFALLKAIFSEGKNKLSSVLPAERILLRAMQDVSPLAINNLSFEPSFISTWTNLKNDSIKLLFNDDASIVDTVTKRFGAAKDFIWE